MLKRDNSERFESLFRDTYEPLLAYARRRLPPEAADDVVSETLTVAWRRIDHVPNDALPWLYGVARRVVWEEHRAQRRRAALRDRARDEARFRLSSEGTVDRPPIMMALAALDERDREAILLTAWEGLQPAQAAIVLGCSGVAFRVRLHRARSRLRALIAGQDPSADATNPLIVVKETT